MKASLSQNVFFLSYPILSISEYDADIMYGNLYLKFDGITKKNKFQLYLYQISKSKNKL